MPPRKPGITGRPTGPLRAPLDYLFGARSRVAVLRALAAQGSPMSQRELARRAGVQVRSAQQAVTVLVALGLADRIVGGRDYLVSLNRRHRLAPAVVTLFGAEAELFRGVRERLHAWARTGGRRRLVHAVVLFGSAARGDDTTASDLDVLVVTASDRARDAVAEAFGEVADDLRSRSGLDARPLVLSRGVLSARSRRRQPPLPEILADGLVIVGPALRDLVRG